MSTRRTNTGLMNPLMDGKMPGIVGQHNGTQATCLCSSVAEAWRGRRLAGACRHEPGTRGPRTSLVAVMQQLQHAKIIAGVCAKPVKA